MSSGTKRLIVLVAIIGVVLFPFPKTLVPAQRVLVTTKDMHPISGALVRQIWRDYSLEFAGHEEDLPTDAHGRVTFPARRITAPLIWRLIGPLTSIAGQGVHASFGVHTDMFPLSNKDARVMPEVVQRQTNEIWYWLEPES
jgi:hypothetical protein